MKDRFNFMMLVNRLAMENEFSEKMPITSLWKISNEWNLDTDYLDQLETDLIKVTNKYIED